MFKHETARVVRTVALISGLALALWTSTGAATGPTDHDHEQGSGPVHARGSDERGEQEHGHVHAPVPTAYAAAHLPPRIWTDPRMIARGREIFLARCALCHGERGDGRGPGAAGLRLKPADFTDASMVGMMPGNYWFWRVSEGGQAEPFRSQGSAMPAWKSELSIAERWAVIAYAHTLSGHTGPHTPVEHPEAAGGHGHAGHGEQSHGH